LKKFAFTADIHLSRYGQDKIEETTNLPERLHSLKQTLYNIADYCIENKIDSIVIGGDMLHGKSIIYAIAQDLMIEYFETYKDIKFYVIDGNHDLSGKGADVVSALRPLEFIENVKWIGANYSTYKEDNVLFVPYSHEVVDMVSSSSSDILISHFGLNEGMLNSGVSIVSDLSVNKLIGKYQVVLLGHYHKPQEIIRDDIKLYYVGSPIQLDWGEKGDIKRFLVVDTETLEIESIPTKGYKKYIEFEITTENKAEVLENAKKAQDAGHYAKIIKKENVDIDDESFQVVDKTERDITNRGISSSMTNEDRFKKYLEIREIPEDEHEAYLKVAIDVVNRYEGDV
jgi:DNA repair exonuclease SbcCD nuclease subunit